MKPVACVTGASGGIGQSLLEELTKRFTVKALFRQADNVSQRWEDRGCEIVIGGLENPKAVVELVEHCDVVFHCAAKIMGLSAEDFNAVNVLGTQQLASAARRAKCGRFVHLSSIAVYSATPPSNGSFAEDLGLEANDPMDSYSRTKLLSEKTVIETLAHSATEYTILRPTCVYGPHIKSWTLTPLDMIRKKRPLFLGLDGGDGLMDAVYVEDLVAAMLLAAESRSAAGEIFNIGGGSVPFRDYYDHLGRMIGQAPRFGSEKMIRRLGGVARVAAGFSTAMVEVEKGMATVLRMSRNRDGYPFRKAEKLLGYAPRFTLPMGMLRTELWLRETGVFPRDHHRLSNTDRHYAVRPLAVVRPTTESEIVEAVREAGRRKLRVKAIGALHSFAPVPDTDGICVALDRYRRVLNVGRSSVTVQAGITISELNRELAKHGLALPIHGSHAEQTVAGAISTSTHGGSLRHGTLADHVKQLRIVKDVSQLRIVKGDGEVVELAYGDPEFQGAVVSLGLLGVVSTVTLRCVPEFFLKSEVLVVSVEDWLRDFEALQRDNEYVDCRYHPQTEQVEMLLMNRSDNPGTAAVAPAATASVSMLQRRVASFMFRSLLRILHATGSEALNRSIVERMIGKSYRAGVARCDEALTFTDLAQGEPFPIDDLEFGIPYSEAKAALRDLVEYFRRSRNFPRFFPVHVRCSKAGSHWLSANFAQDVCWLEFWHHPPNPGLYAEVERILRPYRYRVHWGKICVADGEHLRAQVPKWKDFVELRRRWDPSGMFLNDYLAKWFE